jgi:hypothetical protein
MVIYKIYSYLEKKASVFRDFVKAVALKQGPQRLKIPEVALEGY